MGIVDELLGGGQRQKEYKIFVNRYEQGRPVRGLLRSRGSEAVKVKCHTPCRLTSTAKAAQERWTSCRRKSERRS